MTWRSAPAATAGQVALKVSSGFVPIGIAWLTRGLNALSHRPVEGGGLIRSATLLAVLGALSAVTPQLSQRSQAELDRRVRLTPLTER